VGFKLLSWIYFPLTVYGREYFPKRGQGFIIASNHISNLDPFIVGITDWRRINYMAKDSLFVNKILAFFLTAVNTFPVKRNTADFYAVREAMRRLKSGKPLLMFPEGTRKADEKRNNPGVGLIVAKSNVPVVPVFIIGSDKSLPPKARFLKRHPVRVYIGKPMRFSKEEDYQVITDKIMERIFSLSPEI
jgi:1-acyl-sn-glycerol-3-phosphate acyltransferase